MLFYMHVCEYQIETLDIYAYNIKLLNKHFGSS